MMRAAEIIDALLARRPGALLLERMTRLPYGWAFWIRARAATPLPPVPAQPLELALAAGARVHERAPPLGRWAAMLSLLRQGWYPAPRDERPLRWCSGVGSTLLHVLFFAALLWMAYLQSLVPPSPAAGGGGDRVQVGFVAREGEEGEAGAEAGVTAATEAADGATRADAAAPPVPQADDARPFSFLDIPVPTPPDAAPMPPLPDEAPTPAQPVQVTVVDVPTIAHVLPPTTPPAAPVPEVREREVALVIVPRVTAPQPRPVDVPQPPLREPQLRPREIEVPEAIAAPVLPDRTLPVRDAAMPAMREPAVRQREIAMLEQPPVPVLRAPDAGVREVMVPAAPGPQLREREIETRQELTRPMARVQVPQAAVAAPPSPEQRVRQREIAPRAAPAAAASMSPAAAPTTAGQPPAAGDRNASADDWSRGPAADAWAQSGPAPGSGLFDGDGRARLPDAAPGPGAAERGAPGGDNDRWTESRIAESGSWMQRPADDFSRTRFDQYWVPNESLLADWVRRGVRNMSIPIPGTSRRINCVISLLQLGGGCGVSDDNLNEQPAVARPPPDVPFKPDLQEDNGSVRPQR